MTDYPDRNLLANAISPYLIQHRDNPVHWREWGAAAFAEAESTGKPILLSIGYAACHWCHVMAHESFEDADTAALMNRYFVNIKVDREERPDVDQVYMTALQAMGEQGGWPLTLFLTPKREPFWGGTYFPPTAQYGRPGFKDVLIAVARLHEDDPGRVAGNADAIKRRLDNTLLPRAQPVRPDIPDIDAIATRLHGAVDPVNGGIGSAPKFPSATMWECLWRGWLRRGDPALRQAAIAWIRALCRGGIYDHLGGGLHRYTVDARWLVPHFEKMLYDNAQFIRALCLCHRESPSDLFRHRIEQTVGFLLARMRLSDGGFISSFDADSDGVEGAFYVWTKAEIDAVLGPDAAAFCAAYDVTEAGNWEGRVILNGLTGDHDDSGVDDPLLARCRQRLLERRAQRSPPSRDEKVLADWNGLAIRALAEAAATLRRPDWLAAAQETFAFITTSVSHDGCLAHAWRDGRISGPALATDLAAMVNAAVTLYAATLDTTFLVNARAFVATLEDSHGDGDGSYFLAPASRDDLLVRARNDHDEAIPSATAMIIEALARLSLVTDDPELATKADRALCAAWGRVRANPYTAVGIANAADTAMRGAKLITTGPADIFADAKLRHADPARIDLHVADIATAHRLIGSVPDISANATPPAAAYLCRDMACLPPVFDAAELNRMLSQPANRHAAGR